MAGAMRVKVPCAPLADATKQNWEHACVQRSTAAHHAARRCRRARHRHRSPTPAGAVRIIRVHIRAAPRVLQVRRRQTRLPAAARVAHACSRLRQQPPGGLQDPQPTCFLRRSANFFFSACSAADDIALPLWLSSGQAPAGGGGGGEVRACEGWCGRCTCDGVIHSRLREGRSPESSSEEQHCSGSLQLGHAPGRGQMRRAADATLCEVCAGALRLQLQQK